MGFSQFGIDSWSDVNNNLGKSYQALLQFAPMILEHQGSREMTGFLLEATPIRFG